MNALTFQVKTTGEPVPAGRPAQAVRAGVAALVMLSAAGCATLPTPVAGKPGTTFGKIYVDTPEVYSRERLVNDRFQQDAWLREKLSENPTQGLQGGIGSSSRKTTDLALAAGVKPQAPAREALEASATPGEIGDTPIEQMRDVMAYREEVRNEILENQLDDRHDIAGNTLYRLKFDATIVPLHDTSAWAMVEVTIRGSALWAVTGDFADVLYPDFGQQEPVPLPEYDFARYVTGLDTATMNFYGEVYRDWVRDIDPSKYSEDELVYGPLQAYFDIDDVSGGLERKTNCEYYADEAQRRAARDELRRRNVPAEYLRAGGYYEVADGVDEDGNEFTEAVSTLELCVESGLANFIADLKDHDTTIYTYAVTPKERVQRVYGNSLASGAVGISLGAEQEGIGAALAHSNAREARANAIMRQPQIVGYSPKAHLSSEATMGWLIGPRYKISDDPDGLVTFRHVPTQNTLTGIVSVPSWWRELVLVTRTFWMDENGVEYTQDGKPLTADADNGHEVKITLPADSTSIYAVLDPKRREPRVDHAAEAHEQDELMACRQGTVVIRGTQLWRSTVVTLGGQKADSISVLPNMKGIIATFNEVQPSISGAEPLYVWTSEGEEFVRTMTISGTCEGAAGA